MKTILVVGGGYAGCSTAWRPEEKLRRDETRVVVVDPRPYMTRAAVSIGMEHVEQAVASRDRLPTAFDRAPTLAPVGAPARTAHGVPA